MWKLYIWTNEQTDTKFHFVQTKMKHVCILKKNTTDSVISTYCTFIIRISLFFFVEYKIGYYALGKVQTRWDQILQYILAPPTCNNFTLHAYCCNFIHAETTPTFPSQ